MGNTQPISDPVMVTKNGQAVGSEFVDMRRGYGALGPASTTGAGNRSGVFPGGSALGQTKPQDLAGVWAGGMQIQFKAGHFGVDRGSGNLYEAFVWGSVPITLDPGDATNPRYDYAVLRQRDPAIDGGEAVTESAKIIVLKGTPSAVPTEPTLSITPGDLLLGCYYVGANATSLTDAVVNAGDRRRFVTARGAITPYTPGDGTIGAYDGDAFFNLTDKSLDLWDNVAGAMVTIASRAGWKPFTPKLIAVAGGANSVCWLGAAGSAKGYYLRQGRVVHLRYVFRGARPMNMYWGQVYTQLPDGMLSSSNEEQSLLARLGTIDGNFGFHGQVVIPPGSSFIYPLFNVDRSSTNVSGFQVASGSGVAGTGIPRLPSPQLPDPALLALQGAVELQ